jgi:hypothetical protein
MRFGETKVWRLRHSLSDNDNYNKQFVLTRPTFANLARYGAPDDKLVGPFSIQRMRNGGSNMTPVGRKR